VLFINLHGKVIVKTLTVIILITAPCSLDYLNFRKGLSFINTQKIFLLYFNRVHTDLLITVKPNYYKMITNMMKRY
jgi:hypothetical protein